MEHSWNRNTLALLLIGLAAQKAGAQPIIRFSDPGAAWHVAWTRPAGDINHPNFIGTTTTTYRFNGDTLADGPGSAIGSSCLARKDPDER